MNLRHEIPARAFINAQIIREARNTPDFQKSIQKVISSPQYNAQGLDGYQYENPAYVASLLYCLIVVPKELWANPISDDSLYAQIEEHCPKDLFHTIIAASENKKGLSPTRLVIYHLRNAVAHARYSVDSNMRFIFWDQKSESSPIYWKAEIASDKLMIFLSKVGTILANEGLKAKGIIKE